MKNLLYIIVLLSLAHELFPQDTSHLNFIFVPHPRSENKDPQNVLPVIAKIDYSAYDMVLLGGDLTWSVSSNVKWMDYCNTIFGLGNLNALWTLGNHDTGNRTLISSYTGRPAAYAYYRDGVTFVVLDTEINSNGFQSSYIHGSQLDMLNNVCDTITVSHSLVILHHRILWMINNEYFSTKTDSVGESTKQLDTTNFYQDVYPLLKNVASKGIEVFCLGGDKSKINIHYSPAENIRFFSSAMAPEFPDSLNNVIVFDFNPDGNLMKYEFIPLSKIQVKALVNVSPLMEGERLNNLLVRKTEGDREFGISLISRNEGPASATIFSLSGKAIKTISLSDNQEQTLQFNDDGVFVIRAIVGNVVYSKIIAVY